MMYLLINFRNLLDERGRELYWEGIRRTDLVRFDLLTSGSYIHGISKEESIPE